MHVQLNASKLPDQFTQELLTAAIDLRQALKRQAATGIDIMPVIVTASTRAASTQLHQTKSGRSRYADVQLRPLTSQEMKAIVSDLLARTKLPGAPQQPLQDPSAVLRWLAGVPRMLAWAVCGLSGHRGSTMLQEIFLVGTFDKFLKSLSSTKCQVLACTSRLRFAIASPYLWSQKSTCIS